MLVVLKFQALELLKEGRGVKFHFFTGARMAEAEEDGVEFELAGGGAGAVEAVAANGCSKPMFGGGMNA